jgi:hypothetical protein
MAKVYVGTFPSGSTIFGDGEVDPARRMIDEAHAALDRQRTEEERQRKATIANAERTKAMRRARVRRRLTKALAAWLR